MSKVLFVARYPLFGKYNLRTKFDGQMQAIKNLGYEVSFLAYDEKFFYLIEGENKIPLKHTLCAKSSFFHHFLSYILLYISTIKVLRIMKWTSEDYAYIRLMPRDFFWKWMKMLMKRRGMKVIVEIPTYIREGGEKPKLYIRIANAILDFWGKDKNTSLYTVIGDEANGFYNNTPAINIDNGINVHAFKPCQPRDHNGFNMIAVGNMADWHGFDRVIDGLSLYNNKEGIRFFVVGPDGDGSLEKWKKLSEAKGLSEIVHFKGPMFGDELLSLLNNCDVAFASLGMYRTGCFNASVLKSREYMSRGIPFVYAVNDPVLDSTPIKYALKISNDATPVDISKVVDFFNELSGQSNVIGEMREYAEKYMSWEGQFKKVFNAINAN